MSTLTPSRSFLALSIGQKVLTALTGLFLVTFLVEHLVGNLYLFAGDGGKAFNEYTYFMTHSTFIAVVEPVLFGAFLLHIVLTLRLNALSRAARKTRYAVQAAAKSVPFASRFMVHTGLIFLVWLIVHLSTFFYSRITTEVEELLPGNATPFDEVVHKFGNVWFVAFYVVAMLVMSTHLSHGVYSACQTLGLTVNKGIDRGVRTFSLAFAVVISLGFAAIPVAVYFLHHA